MMGHICTLLMGMVESHRGEAGVARVFELSGVEHQQFRPEKLFQALLPGGLRRVLYGGVPEDVPGHSPKGGGRTRDVRSAESSIPFSRRSLLGGGWRYLALCEVTEGA